MHLPTHRGHVSFSGFTRIDLGALVGTCAALALFFVLPRIARAAPDANAVTCLNNLRRLGIAWSLYAADHQGRVVNNYTVTEMLAGVTRQTYPSWTHNLLDWGTSTPNTNQTLARTGKLTPYHDSDISILHCPSDSFVSTQQKARGWTHRVRSYSMNGFMGSASSIASDPSNKGDNPFGSGYRQFLVTSAIPSPAETVVFLEEHPDSINDGYFINLPGTGTQWSDLPGSYHDGGAGMNFADGSALIRVWQFASTKLAVKYTAPLLTTIPSAQRGDYQWLMDRMSVTASTMAVHSRTNETLEIVWSANPTTFQLQSLDPDSGAGWVNVPGTATRALGRATQTVPIGSDIQLFRLIR